LMRFLCVPINCYLLSFLIIRRSPRPTLFPYTTLFRSVVSQGARPIGPDMVVTRAEENVLYELAGVPALEKLEQIVLELPEEEQRSEEHTSELQSRENLVCRLLLEKKKILV